MADAVRIKVSDTTGHVSKVIEAPPDAYVSDVVAAGLQELDLPRNSPSGTLEYRARHRGRLVPPTERVDETFEDDDVVQLIPEPTAGI
jgi:hypothetical protein